MHRAKTSAPQRLGRGLQACAIGLVVLGIGACAPERDAEDTEPLAQQAIDAGAMPADAASEDVAYSASVTASGSACPPGSWSADIAPDNTRFALSFQAYDVSVGAAAASDVKDCKVTIKLQSESGISFSVAQYAHRGRAALAPGVQGKQTSTWYFFGANVTARLRTTYLTGPLDAPYSSESLLQGDEVFWTPCARQRDLIVISRLQLRNDGSGAVGSAKVANGTPSAGIDIGVMARRCTLPTPPAPR